MSNLHQYCAECEDATTEEWSLQAELNRRGLHLQPAPAGPERVADPNRGFRFTKDMQPHGSFPALIRAGAPWVGMRVTSLIVFVSMADTVLSQPLETYAHLPSGEKVSQSAPP